MGSKDFISPCGKPLKARLPRSLPKVASLGKAPVGADLGKVDDIPGGLRLALAP